MKLILYLLINLIFTSGVKLYSHYINHGPYANVNDNKIDISNNQTYKGRIFNGSLILHDYTNISFGFKPLNMNNTLDLKNLRSDNIDPTLDEDDYNNLYNLITYSSRNKECNFNKKIVLERHNFLRAKHNATALKWNMFLEQKAKDLAQNLEKENCPNKKQSDKKLGVLMFNGFGTIYNEEEIVNHFYEGAYSWKWKDFTLNKFDYNFYDFAQILWKETDIFGCAKACCLNNQIWVCFYNPPSIPNDVEQLKKNLNTPNKYFKEGFN